MKWIRERRIGGTTSFDESKLLPKFVWFVSPINGLGPRRVATKKVTGFCLVMKFPPRSSGTVRKHGEGEREKVGNSLVVTSWSLLNVVIVNCALRFLEFYSSLTFFMIVLVLYLLQIDKCFK